MTAPSVLVLACGALARELLAVVEANRLPNVTVEFLPAQLHNRPDLICGAVGQALDRLAPGHDRVLLGYGDCGTGGGLDRLCAERGIERLGGAHCYEFFAGHELFSRLHDAEPGTFYLTDYLARHFDRLIIDGLGIAEHPELEKLYFGHYRKLVHLAQVDDHAIGVRAQAAAERLGLDFEQHLVGLDRLTSTVVTLAGSAGQAAGAPRLVGGHG